MDTSYCNLLLLQFGGKPMVLDSNLLLLLLVGSFDPKLIASFKRLSGFSTADLRILRRLSTNFPVATSPHVLTEVSNLANALPEHTKQRVFPYMASRIELLEEIFVPAKELVKISAFSTFGLTDTALAVLSKDNLFITHDERFATYLRKTRQLPVLTLSDLRAGESEVRKQRQHMFRTVL